MTAQAPQTGCERIIPLLLVKELRLAIDYYISKLGFQHGFTWGDPPEIAGVNLGEVQVHLYEGELRHNAVYFVVNDADELYEYHRSQGVEILFPPENRAYELRDYAVRDPWGNQLSFGHYIQATEPKLKIERVEMTVRLEKRLAALLADLAAYKGMTIGSCLEETLLHTFEVIGKNEAVASPHTKKAHAFIQELKKKHGIEYDVHASYRFVE